MAPISMSAARKRRPSKKEPDYTPSAADEFPFGAPSSSKDNTIKANAPPKDAPKKEEVMHSEKQKRKPKGTRSVDASSSKRRKMVADAADVTAFESSPKKRIVEQVAGPIDDLSVKPSKVPKVLPVPKVTDEKKEPTKKRPASTPVFRDNISAKKAKTDSENVCPITSKAHAASTKKRPADTPVFTDPIFGKRAKTVSEKTVSENPEQAMVKWFDPTEESPTSRSQDTALLAIEPKEKRDTPISLQALAEAEKAGPADLPAPASSSATAAVPKKRSRKAKTKTVPADTSAVDASAVNTSAVDAGPTSVSPIHAAPQTEAGPLNPADPSLSESSGRQATPEKSGLQHKARIVRIGNASRTPKAAASTTSSPTKAKESSTPKTKGSTPVYNPSACFTQALPAALTPWPHSCPAPTPRLDQPLSVSPINWANVKGATDQQVEAYEIRQPWNPDPNTFAYVAQNTRFQCKGKAPTEEGIRKRFKAASLAVFKASGVYFEGNGIGLEAYGVPKKNSELKELIQQAATPTTAAATATPATSSSDSQSTGTPASSAQLASDAAGTGVSSSRPPAAVRRALRRARRAALRAIPRRDNRQDADEHRPKAFYTGQVVTVQLHSTSPIPAYRNADAKLIPKYDSLLREEVSETCHARPVVLTFIPELPFSPAAFDRWFATVFFGTRTSFPTQDFVCSEVAKDTYMIKEMARDREGEQVDIATVLETYILSTVLGTNTAASDMLFSELQSRIAAQSSGDEGPVPSNVHQRMQAYIEKDERLRDMNIEFQVADKREDDRSDDDVDDYDEHEPYRPTLKNFVDRPSNYKIPPFTDIWKDATVPKYDQISGAHQPSVEDDDDWYL